MKVKVKFTRAGATMPEYKSADAACFDLHALDHAVIEPGETLTLDVGLAFEFPRDHTMLVHSRSGHVKHGIRLANATGVIDADYRGSLRVSLRNDGREPYYIQPGNRIAQAMILPLPRVEFEEVDELSVTERGDGGMGSTGA